MPPPNLADAVDFVLKHRHKIAAGLAFIAGLLEDPPTPPPTAKRRRAPLKLKAKAKR